MSPANDDTPQGEQAASTTHGGNSSSTSAEFEPPLACIRRILKQSLPKNTNVGKDASMAFSRACGIFCIYLTTCANDFAREHKRTTITAADILAAMKELDFDEFVPQLELFLAEHRADEKRKKEAKALNTSSLVAMSPLNDDEPFNSPSTQGRAVEGKIQDHKNHDDEDDEDEDEEDEDEESMEDDKDEDAHEAEDDATADNLDDEGSGGMEEG